MATTPSDSSPQQPTGGQQYGYLPGSGNAFASLPIPGNAELVVFLVVELLIALIVLIADDVGAGAFIEATKWITAAYLISRGIAKASRVLEQ
jgi:hypothetical protein